MTEIFVNGRRLTCSTVLGAGTESVVHAVDGDSRRAAKIYREPDARRTRRLECMLRAFHASQFVDPVSGHPGLVWPEELARDSTGAVLGYVMRRSEDQPLSTFFEHYTRLTNFPGKDWKFLLGVASNLSQLVAVLHDQEIVIGDLAPSNIHVRADGLISFLDCDSLQFRYDGEVFACHTVTPEYAAPELLPELSGRKSVETDRFTLAVLICQLLLCGEHPFQGIPARELDVDPSPETNIQYGITVLTAPREVEVPDEAVEPDVLPPPIAALARQTFGAGHGTAGSRPAAQEWADALDLAWDDVQVCGNRRGHTYSGHLPECPWCARARTGRFDPFPALSHLAGGADGGAAGGGVAPTTKVTNVVLAVAILLLLALAVVVAVVTR
ncbi:MULTISPECIES: protein kinase domain-containing protein [unclassified Frankia]|uniref:protein kinase domain-containing protein n=1 Tax=unclassified Frankia TaxID=2632575 RepID=UPI0020245A95